MSMKCALADTLGCFPLMVVTLGFVKVLQMRDFNGYTTPLATQCFVVPINVPQAVAYGIYESRSILPNRLFTPTNLILDKELANFAFESIQV